MSYTDTQLKQTLAKMLPEAIGDFPSYGTSEQFYFWWKPDKQIGHPIKDTELLHICWLVEQTIDLDNGEYSQALQEVCGVSEESFCPIVDKAIIHSSWQQRTIALAKVKGIEIL